MPQIVEFVVAANKDGLLDIVAVAEPGEGGDDEFSGAVWINQQITAVPLHQEEQWAGWRTLGEPGYSRTGISMAANPDGRLEVALAAAGSTVWHAWQDVPDGDWSAWGSLDSPGPEARFWGIRLAQNQDGGLSLFTTVGLPRPAVWRRRQAEPGRGPWSKWQSLGFPAVDSGDLYAPTVVRNRDGRLEAFITAGAQVWHSWQTRANSDDWAPWASLDTPHRGDDPGWPAVACDKDGRLQLFVAVGTGEIWRRAQAGAGQGPWEPWAGLIGEPRGVAQLAAGAQADGRLTVFALSATPEGAQRVDKLEEIEPGGHFWIEEVVGTEILSLRDLAIQDPALVACADGRLRLFFRNPSHTSMYILNQTEPNGTQWLDEWQNFRAPFYVGPA
jgi:hypothetical protein